MGDQKCHPRSPLIIKVVMDETKVREGDIHSFTPGRVEILSPTGLSLYCSLARLVSPSLLVVHLANKEYET